MVSPEDRAAMISAIKSIDDIDRTACRRWVEESASHKVFAKRVERWIISGLKNTKSNSFKYKN